VAVKCSELVSGARSSWTRQVASDSPTLYTSKPCGKSTMKKIDNSTNEGMLNPIY
jgi:hypothetical protein